MNEQQIAAMKLALEAWAETAMRLAADLSIESLRLGSYERKDTYENAGRASWQTIEIREKREAARERLRQHVYTSTQAQLAQQQEPVVWNVIDPFGKIVATEKDAIRGWARIQGYKPTVESLLGFQEQGWRVVPASPPPAQRKPLTDAQINAFFEGMEPNNGFWLSFARAIEAAHGIKENT